MLNRRKFLQASAMSSAAMLSDISFAQAEVKAQKLTILHTNDVHSRLEAFPADSGRNAGMGGVAARAALIKKIRQEEEHVLLLDAGDIFQGTPYFNIFKGEPDIKAMSLMQYDACTMGNHDFDEGIENFRDQMARHSQFPLIICNYDFSGTVMEHRFEPYRVFKKGKLKIGVTGVGIELEGLVPEKLTGSTKYLDPIERVREVSHMLKVDKQCDMVICLSHLGFKYSDNKISDLILAKETEKIDLIVGGHTHTFLDSPVSIKNRIGQDVLINQVGWGGIMLGRMDFIFEGGKNKNLSNSNTVVNQ
jgi:5'-nucleotidase